MRLIFKIYIAGAYEEKKYICNRKRTNLKKSSILYKDFFLQPEKYLKYKKETYSPEYIRQLKYKMKKKYQINERK